LLSTLNPLPNGARGKNNSLSGLRFNAGKPPHSPQLFRALYARNIIIEDFNNIDKDNKKFGKVEELGRF
jgi:hypothetical protein